MCIEIGSPSWTDHNVSFLTNTTMYNEWPWALTLKNNDAILMQKGAYVPHIVTIITKTVQPVWYIQWIKPEFHILLLTFDPSPQIMKSGIQKYNKCMSVCQQRVNASQHNRYFRQPMHLGRHEIYDFFQHFKDMIGIFTALQVHAFGAGKTINHRELTVYCMAL